MKKRILVVLMFLLMVSLVSASLKVEGPSRDTYNYGDDVAIEGYVFRDDDFNGFLKLSFLCSNQTFPLGVVSLSLEGGEKKQFPGEIALPKLFISSSLSGSCNINVKLVSGANVVEETNSGMFSISKNLEGIFNLDSSVVQIGGKIELVADISKLNGIGTSGSAEIYFETNGTEKYLVDVVSFEDGDLDYQYIVPSYSSSGEYTIDLLINDYYGNQQYFDDVANFILMSELDLDVNTNVKSVMPGESIEIYGEVKTVLQEKVDSGSAKISLDGDNFVCEIEGGSFSYTYEIPNNFPSGEHVFKVSVMDELGNKGSVDVSFQVTPIVTSLGLELEKDYNPGVEISLIPMIYDQAGEVVEGESVSLEIIDPGRKTVFRDVVDSGDSLEIELSRDAKPGEYVVKAYALGVSKDFKFGVNELMIIGVELNNQSLIVTNTGNVKYTKPIEVELNLGEYTIVKKNSLAPGEVLEIRLDEEVPSGIYDVRVPLAENGGEFRRVVIVGKSGINITWIYWLLAIGVIILLYYLFKGKKRERKQVHFKKRKDFKEGEEIKKEKERRETEDERVKKFRKRIANTLSGKKKKKFSFGGKKEGGYITIKVKDEEGDSIGSNYNHSGYKEERASPYRSTENKGKSSDEPSSGFMNMFG